MDDATDRPVPDDAPVVVADHALARYRERVDRAGTFADVERLARAATGRAPAWVRKARGRVQPPGREMLLSGVAVVVVEYRPGGVVAVLTVIPLGWFRPHRVSGDRGRVVGGGARPKRGHPARRAV